MVDNDLDIWMKAMEKIDLTEAVSPIYKGHLILEDTQVEFYNKIQKLLNSKGMEDSHAWLYDLDPTELTECECDKVNRLYSLAQDRGLIEPDEPEEPEEPVAPEPIEQPAPQIPVQRPVQQAAFTVIYSATRDGSIKTGEAYSNSINTRSAKADVISKLERAGYQNVSILAIEASDPDMCGCNNTFVKQSDYQVPDYSVTEADDREPLGHALDDVGIKASTANLRRNNAVAASYISDSDEVDDDTEQDEAISIGKDAIGKPVLEDDPEEKEDIEKSDSDEKTEKSDEKSDDTEDTEKEEDKKTEEKPKEEPAEEPDEKLKDDKKAEDAEKEDSEDGKELSSAEKESLKDSYKKAFKAALEKGKYGVSFSELDLEQKIKFFTDLSKVWGSKADPSKFMDEKSQEQLEKIVVKKQ